MGYHRAGFEVVGIDIEPQPNYPFKFWEGDAVQVLDTLISGGGLQAALYDAHWDAIHTSPPCQAYTIAQNARKQAHLHPDLIAEVRRLLEQTGLPYVIENVPGAPLHDPVVLCGTSFGLQADGFELRRHRLFETNFPTMAMPCYHNLPAAPVFGHNPNGDFMKRYGRGYNIEHRKAVMGIDWMNRDELAEAIPPVFTEHIGSYLMTHLSVKEAT